MAHTRCIKCDELNEIESIERRRKYTMLPSPVIEITCGRESPTQTGGITGKVTLEGVITCLVDGHRWPVKMVNRIVTNTSESMPGAGSADLNTTIPPGLVEDVEEAERCHFMQAYKATVVMCKRDQVLCLQI